MYSILFALLFFGYALITDHARKKSAPPSNPPSNNHQKPAHPEPHRDPETGKIVIENSQLYTDDLLKYGAIKVGQWVKEGRYNLTPEELMKENERLRQKYRVK